MHDPDPLQKLAGRIHRLAVKPWQVLLVGGASLVIGRATLGLRVAPYQPAINAGYPDARTVVVNGAMPILLMLAGAMISIFALGWMLQRLLAKRSVRESKSP